MTGSLVPLNSPGWRDFEGHIFFYFTNYTKRGKHIDLSIDGIHECTLPRGSYYLYKSDGLKESVEACITCEVKKVCTNISTSLFQEVLYLITLKNNKPEIQLMKDNMERELFDDINNGMADEYCKGK